MEDETKNREQTESMLSEEDSQKAAVANAHKDTKINIYILVCILGVSLGILIETIYVQYEKHNATENNHDKTLKYWVYSAHNDVENKNGLLKHVHLTLERVGYEKSTNKSTWTLLWSHDYPFRVLYPHMHKLKSYQKVNHFPGTGFITSKVDLAITPSKYIPKAFKLPQNKDDFLKYALDNKNALFLEKNNQHRGVYLKNVSEIDFSGESFVQEYVQRPFLVDGHKFDIGVYVAITSVNPLRAYWYKGDVLFRYCPEKYYPFNPKILDKYVVGDDYLPTWEVPSLAHPYTALGLSMKDAFDVYATSKGKNPHIMWDEVQKAIAELIALKEKHIIEALKNYPAQSNFFELMRFDLVVDEDLKVYLLEANMSPNLSSAHFPPNQLLYEQVLYSLFGLTGISNPLRKYEGNSNREQLAAQNMISAQKNIAVWGNECSSQCKDDCESVPICGLCRPCLGGRLRNSLLTAHEEYLHRGDFRRLFPRVMKPNASISTKELEDLSPINRLQHLWFQGKCNIDITWCS